MSLPRVLGYAFNPITFIYCYKNALLEAMIYEVNNTFNERIFYILPVINQPIRQCAKKMTVSPFFDLSGRYDFRISIWVFQMWLIILKNKPENACHLCG